MTNIRRALIAITAMAAFTGIASATSIDTVIGFTTTVGPTATDLLNETINLPSWNPGDADVMTSNVSGSGLSTGVSMSSLDAAGVTYTLVGYDITVKETLTGNYTITNGGTTTATGSAYIDTYTAVALGSTLSPPLSNVTDPTNDLFNCSVTDTGLPSTTCTQGEQATSLGGGPDPNAPAQTGLNIAPSGGTYTSPTINVNSKFVDYGCEITGQSFCNESSNSAAVGNLITYDMSQVEGGDPLDFNVSTATQSTLSLTGGNNTASFNTSVTEQVSVFYEYTTSEETVSSTPEPTTMLLFGSGLVGLGLLRRRARKS